LQIYYPLAYIFVVTSNQGLLPNLRLLLRYTPGSCLRERDETREGAERNSMTGGTHDSRL